MMRIALNRTLVILFAANCGCAYQIQVCNGTGEPVIFASGDAFPKTVTVEPCTCETMRLVDPDPGDSGFFLFAVGIVESVDDTEPVTFVRLDSDVDPTPGPDDIYYITFDGTIEMAKVLNDPRELEEAKITVTLVNESSQAVHIRIGLDKSGDRALAFSQTLIPAGGSRQYSTINPTRSDVAVTDPDLNLGDTGYVIASNSACAYDDGTIITWDGSTITCDDGGGPPPPPPPPPPGTANVTCINNSDRATIFFYEGITAQEGVTVPTGGQDVLAVPTGNPIGINIISVDQVLGGDCTVNDPSDGDQVIWDGVTATCVEAAPASAPTSSVLVPLIQMGNAAMESVSEYAEELLEELNPF